MQLSVLGPIAIITEQGRQPVRGEKVRTTLALLALDAGRLVTSDRLVNELWPDQPIGNARNALQAHITRLRRLLDGGRNHGAGGSLIQTIGTCYQLDLPPEALDSNRFRQLAGLGAASRAENPRQAVALLEEALRLWHGPALLDAGPGPACRAAACWLDENRLMANEDLIAARLALGEDRAVVPELEELTARYPLRERFTELLMVALYRCGRQVDAVNAYHRLRLRLTGDIGLDPGDRLQKRYLEILLRDPALRAVEAAA